MTMLKMLDEYREAKTKESYYMGPSQQEMSDIMDAMIEIHLPAVQEMADKIYNSVDINIDYEDLLSAGIFGLIHSIETYDPNNHPEFIRYSRPRIKTSLLDAVRIADWTCQKEQLSDEAGCVSMN